jgi:hypothetical protein
MALGAEVIGIIRVRYSDFGPTLAAEKLAELDEIHLARETVRQWMIAAGLWKDLRARMRPECHQPADASAVCREREHLRLFCGDASLSGAPWQAGGVLLR